MTARLARLRERVGTPGEGAIEADVRAVLSLTARLGWPALHDLSPAEARREADREARMLAGPRPPAAAVRRLSVDGAAGPLEARLYSSRKSAAQPEHPLVVYFHGGGFVFGSPASHDTVCRLLADLTGARVLSCSYRLAPEHPFPAAAEDALAAFAWARAHAGELGADPARVAVAGDSAGGNLAASVAREAEQPPCAQLLLYPITDLSHEHGSYRTHADGPVLDAAAMRWFRRHYLGDGARAADPLASPLLADDLSGLPPAHVAVAEHDPLRDEACAYAERMRAAGVPVELDLHPRQPHAYAEYAGVAPSCRAAFARAAHWLAKELHR